MQLELNLHAVASEGHRKTRDLGRRHVLIDVHVVAWAACVGGYEDIDNGLMRLRLALLAVIKIAQGSTVRAASYPLVPKILQMPYEGTIPKNDRVNS
ncbi:MAG: hypothetical protein ACRDH8_06465 [Actinomycetota bacterium]